MRDLRRRGLIYQGRMGTKVSENLVVGNRTVSPAAYVGPLGVRDGHRDGANNADAARFVTFRASQTSVRENVWLL